MAKERHVARKGRASRVRYKIKQVIGDRLRLTVHRSLKQMYAQIIDDRVGHTVVSASTLEPELRSQLKHCDNVEAATLVGKTIAERAVKANVTKVVFDRGGYIYHGRTKALADAARANGLEF